jgi:hypothetical protein
MDSIPSVLSSAQSVLNAGFSRLDTAAARVASYSASVANAQDPSSSDGDPLVSAVVDTIQAREEVGSGVALMNTYQRMTDDLMEMSDPAPRYRHIDLYA